MAKWLWNKFMLWRLRRFDKWIVKHSPYEREMRRKDG